MKIDKNEVHIWSSSLLISPSDLAGAHALLSPDETARAARFHFPLHRHRFIAARSWLRRILSAYLDTPPAAISFSYTEHNKPYLSPSGTFSVQFNLSHSSDMAICAITHNQNVGIDIEEIKKTNYNDLAKRFFSPDEYNHLIHAPEENQAAIFYAIWVRKEAILKATGKGLSIPLNKFTVHVQSSITHIELENQSWSLLPLSIHTGYQAALAIAGSVKKISYWNWHDAQPKLDKEEII